MYFAVSWLEPRLNINQSAMEWREARTGPEDVRTKFVKLKQFKRQFEGGQWISRDIEVYLVSGAGDLRPGHLRPTESPQGDVRGQNQQEQDHHIWTGVRLELSSLNTLIRVISSVRISISCQMNFDDYPLDKHTCQFQVGSCKSFL